MSLAEYLRVAAAKDELEGVRAGHIDGKDYAAHVLRHLRSPPPRTGTPSDKFENWLGACIRVVGLDRAAAVGEYIRQANRMFGGGSALVEMYARRIRTDPLPPGCCNNADLMTALEGVVPPDGWGPEPAGRGAATRRSPRSDGADAQQPAGHGAAAKCSSTASQSVAAVATIPETPVAGGQRFGADDGLRFTVRELLLIPRGDSLFGWPPVALAIKTTRYTGPKFPDGIILASHVTIVDEGGCPLFDADLDATANHALHPDDAPPDGAPNGTNNSHVSATS
jgi:hypothetical protein